MGTLYLTISNLIFIIIGFAINVLLGRILGPSDYGIYGIIISLMTTVNIIQTSGLPQATSNFISSVKYDSNKILGASLRLQLLSTSTITLLLLLFAYPLSILLNDKALFHYILATALILPFYAVYALYAGYYNGMHDFKRQAITSIAYSTAKGIAVIGFLYIFHLYGVIAGFIIAPIVALLFGFRLPQKVTIEKSLFYSLIIFSLPLIGFAILSTLLISIDLFFIKALLSDTRAPGFYTASQNIARIPFFALSAFAMMLLPIISKSIHTETLAETSTKIRETLRYLALLLVPGTVLIAVTSSPLLQLLYTKSYIPAAESLSWLAVGLACITLFVALANIITADDKPGTAMSIAGVGLILTTFFCWLLIPHYGLVGAAMATTIGGCVAMLCALYVVSKRFPGAFGWMSAGKILLASLCMAVVPLTFTAAPLLLPVIYLCAGVVYGAALFLLKELTVEELKGLVHILRPTKISHD